LIQRIAILIYFSPFFSFQDSNSISLCLGSWIQTLEIAGYNGWSRCYMCRSWKRISGSSQG